jgi:NADH-quinone oxidoreductase subunit N
VIPTPKVDWLALSPALALLAAAGVALLGSVLVPKWMRRVFAAFIAFAGFVTAGVLAAIVFDQSAESRSLIAESFTRDRLGALAAIIVAGAGALTVLVSWGENRRDHAGEYYALLAAAGAGMAFFVTAGNLMTLFLGLEWFSISLYILCALDTHRETSLEAASARRSCSSARRSSTGQPVSSGSARSQTRMRATTTCFWRASRC